MGPIFSFIVGLHLIFVGPWGLNFVELGAFLCLDMFGILW